jgi:predicted DNA-binding transcriptional regulator
LPFDPEGQLWKDRIMVYSYLLEVIILRISDREYEFIVVRKVSNKVAEVSSNSAKSLEGKHLVVIEDFHFRITL